MLLELDMKQVFYFGFLTGVATSAALAGGGMRAWRSMTIQPDAVYRTALHKLARNGVVRGEIGTAIRSGSLKAYVVHPGHVSMDRGLRWVDPRVQMLFQVVGDKGEGMATVEAVKLRGGALSFSLLTLDTLATPTRKSSLILVAGKEEKLHVRGTLRGFLQTERAQYVAQDKTESDEDRIAEQEELEPTTAPPTPEGAGASGSGSAAAATTQQEPGTAGAEGGKAKPSV
jgi:hypothetical protein